MNAYYYEMRLSRIQKENFLLELMTASAASGSAIAALGFWKSSVYGQTTWALLSVAAAMASIIKPIYAPGKKIENFTRQHQSYHNNYFALQKLIYALQQSDDITVDLRKRYETIFDRHVQLSADDERSTKLKALKRAEQRCAEALPADAFWQHWADRMNRVPADTGHSTGEEFSGPSAT